MNNEIELKLRLNATELPLLEKVLSCSPYIRSPTLKLLNRYFDTPTMRLSQGGAALRIRQQNELDTQGLVVSSRIIQTLKTRGTSTSGLHQRMEWDWPLTEVDLNLDLIRNSEASTYLQAGLNLDAITPLFTTDFQRKVWMYQQHDTVIEVVLDQGEVSTDEHNVDLLELELELKQGRPEVLFELAKDIADQCPVVMSDISKAERGYGLLSQSTKHTVIKKDWSEEIPVCEFNQVSNNSIACFKQFFSYHLSALQRSIEYSVWDNNVEQADHVTQQLKLLKNLIRIFENFANSSASENILLKIEEAQKEPFEMDLVWGQLTLLCGHWLFESFPEANTSNRQEIIEMTPNEIVEMKRHIHGLHTISNHQNNLAVDTLSKGMGL